MKLCNIGRTITDDVRLCYTADDLVRQEFTAIGKHKQEDGFVIVRSHNEFFKHCFDICWGEFGNRSESIAQIYFSHIGNMFESEDELNQGYIFVKLANRMLYQPHDEIRKVLAIPTLYSMEFHHFTRVDLAKDFKKDYVKVINRLMRRTDIATIINGTWEDNHKKLLKTLKEFRSRTLDRAVNPELIVTQENALKNKNNGIIASAYNKLSEIKAKQADEAGYKQYILDFYGNPQKSLHRLEVRVNAANITKYCKCRNIPVTEEILFDDCILTDMYYHFLSRVLSFTHVSTAKSGKRWLRKPIPWEEIFSNKKLRY